MFFPCKQIFTCLACIVVLLNKPVQAQFTFQNYYDQGFALSMAYNRYDKFAFAGRTDPNQNPEGLIYQTNGQGNTEWAKVLRTNQASLLYQAVIPLRDGSWLAAGHSYHLAVNEKHSIITRLDSSGNHLMSVESHADSISRQGFTRQLSPRDLVISTTERPLFATCGFGFTDVSALQEAYVFCYDLAGNLRWHYAFGLPNSETAATTMLYSEDHHFLIAGETQFTNQTNWGFITKMDSNGVHRWTYQFAGLLRPLPVDIVEYDNHYYVLANEVFGSNMPFLLKLDQHGRLVWQKLFLTDVPFEPQKLLLHSSGNLVIAGYHLALFESDPVILIADIAGSVLESWAYRDSTLEASLHSMLEETNDGALALGGSYQKVAQRKSKNFLFKVAPRGPGSCPRQPFSFRDTLIPPSPLNPIPFNFLPKGGSTLVTSLLSPFTQADSTACQGCFLSLKGLRPLAPLCQGNRVNLLNPHSGATNHQWLVNGQLYSQAPDTHFIVPAPSASYQITLIADVCGRRDTASFHFSTYPNPVAGFTYTYLGQDSVQFQDTSSGPPQSWLWDFGDGNTASVRNPVHHYTSAGNYTACLIVRNACRADTTCFPVNILTSALAPSQSLFKLWPNPVRDHLALQFNTPAPASYHLSVADYSGRVLKSWNLNGHPVPRQGKKIMLEVDDLVPGLYILRLQSNTHSFSQKFLKQ